MLGREKVIAWLTEISLRPCDFARDDYDANETERLANDAIEIVNAAEIFCRQRNEALARLKEQEPRVMASNELQPDELVWIEVPQSDEIWPALLRKSDWFDHPTWAMRGYALCGYYLHSGYGRDWRCWTAKPTENQRLAVKWDA